MTRSTKKTDLTGKVDTVTGLGRDRGVRGSSQEEFRSGEENRVPVRGPLRHRSQSTVVLPSPT